MLRKKGFTLIEIMLIISIIALLSVILVPKVGAVRMESKNNSVNTNVLLIRTYMENRSGKDGNRIQNKSLDTLLKSIQVDMSSDFSGSNSLINPFNGSKSIDARGDASNKNISSSSSVLLYYSSGNLPENNEVIKSGDFPDGVNIRGTVVVVLYGSSQNSRGGYALYGIDNFGAIVRSYIVKFPAAPSLTDGSDNSDGSTIQDNVNRVIKYIKVDAIRKIITGVPNGQMYNVIQGPLYNDLKEEFTPGDSSKHIVNPYHLNKDAIDDDGYHTNGDPGISYDYSIICNANPGDYSSMDSKYAGYPGNVVVYVTNNPVGYVVYGVDKNGNTISKTPVNLSTEITSSMTQSLEDNVNAVSVELDKIVKKLQPSNDGDYNRRVALQLEAKNKLQELSLKNAYLPDWIGIRTDTYNFSTGISVIVELKPENLENIKNFKGAVIVDVLQDGSGYEVYGIDYMGNNYAYKKIQNSGD